MTHAVIIDKSISELVNHKKGKAHLLFETDDIQGMVRDLMHRYSGEQCCFLIFCDGKKVSEVCSSFSGKQRILYQLVVISTNADDAMPGKKEQARITSYRQSPVDVREFQFLLTNSRNYFESLLLQEKLDEEYQFRLADTNRDQEDLITIGRSLSLEKNPDRLFRKILSLSEKITGADAGTIYLVEESSEGQKQIRVKYAHTHSRQIKFEEAVLPYNTSTISGYVACTGKVLNIPDAYKLTPSDPVCFNPRFDREHDYITKSMLVVPMKNHVDEIIGVIQLLNSKEKESSAPAEHHQEIILKTPEDFENEVVPFHRRYERLLEAVAGQAAIAVENIRMISQIEEQFEEFVRASVFAIESRDEATSGHSFRVAEMCKAMAHAINRDENGAFGDTKFSESDIKELEYAALLHDYGKVYLDMRLFKKAKKLFPQDYNYLMRKIDLAYRTCELKFLLNEYSLVTDPGSGRESAASHAALCEERKSMLEKLLKIRERIMLLNEPSVLAQEPQKLLAEIRSCLAGHECTDVEGNRIELLGDEENEALSVQRGSLTDRERGEIQNHVMHTYNFVSKIPWPRELAQIPVIALAHHEFIDGTGYPKGLKGKNKIPLQSRMMTIADIYDALTAADRPYKRALTPQKALSLLDKEASEGKIDSDLLALFSREKIYEHHAHAGHRKAKPHNHTSHSQ